MFSNNNFLFLNTCTEWVLIYHRFYSKRHLSLSLIILQSNLVWFGFVCPYTQFRLCVNQSNHFKTWLTHFALFSSSKLSSVFGCFKQSKAEGEKFEWIMNMDLLFCFGSITWTWPLGFLFVSQYLLVLLLLFFFCQTRAW